MHIYAYPRRVRGTLKEVNPYLALISRCASASLKSNLLSIRIGNGLETEAKWHVPSRDFQTRRILEVDRV